MASPTENTQKNVNRKKENQKKKKLNRKSLIGFGTCLCLCVCVCACSFFSLCVCMLFCVFVRFFVRDSSVYLKKRERAQGKNESGKCMRFVCLIELCVQQERNKQHQTKKHLIQRERGARKTRETLRPFRPARSVTPSALAPLQSRQTTGQQAYQNNRNRNNCCSFV